MSEEVLSSLHIIIEFCKNKEKRNASCIGCPLYGAGSEKTCPLCGVDRPSHIIL